MKKLLFSFVTLLFMSVQVKADELILNNVNIQPGGSTSVSVELNNTDNSYRAVLFDLMLPTGVSVVYDEYGDMQIEKGERLSANYSVTGNHLESGAERFGIINTTDDEAIAGESGILFSFTITADAELIDGTLSAAVSAIKLTDAGAVDHVQEAFTFNISVDSRIHFDETATMLPPFSAGAKGNVTMKRTINAGNWSTIVLPFTLTKAKAEAAFGSDVQLAEFSGFEVDYGDDEDNVIPLGITINFSEYAMTAKKGMTGGKPFLIKTSQNISNFEADDVTLFSAVTDVVKSDEFDTSGKLTGSLVKTTIPVDGLFISNNKFWYSPGDYPINAFRCWLELGAVLDKATDFEIKFAVLIDGMETQVEELTRKGNVLSDAYDLSGRKVATRQKGLYIIKGKKTIINK
ncbi:MAG: hypothetical protein J5545_02865 [Bacteroidaceae bacterium]|nr:hypothetical protein [Bacteroidaceae bacterium]